VYPPNAYRNGALYASYTAAMMKNIFELADRRRTNIEGMLTWAFEFEDQPYFDGFRTLATNGIDKPVLNVFRMAGLMRGNRVKTESNGRAALDTILAEGVRGIPDVDALAVRSDPQQCLDGVEGHGISTASGAGAVRQAGGGRPVAVGGLSGVGGCARQPRDAGVLAAAPGCLFDGAELVKETRAGPFMPWRGSLNAGATLPEGVAQRWSQRGLRRGIRGQTQWRICPSADT
jgi:hypothetical protein